MNQVTNDAEEGTNGTTVTTGNSGGAGETAFDGTSNAGAGSAVPTFDNTHTAHGSLAFKIVPGGLGNNSCIQWTTTSIGTPAATTYGRVYLYNPGSLDGNWVFWHYNGSAGSNEIRINSSTNVIEILDENGNVAASSTNAVNVGSFCRIETKIVFSSPDGTANGTIEVLLFNAMDSATPTETITAANIATLSAANFTRLDIGAYDHSGTSSKTAWLDDLVFGAAAYPGPAVTAASPVFYPLRIANKFVGPQALRRIFRFPQRWQASPVGQTDAIGFATTGSSAISMPLAGMTDQVTFATTGVSTPAFTLAGMTDAFTFATTGSSALTFAMAGMTDTFTFATKGVSTPVFSLAGMTDLFTVATTGKAAPVFTPAGMTDTVTFAVTGSSAPVFHLGGTDIFAAAVTGISIPAFTLAGMTDSFTFAATGLSAPAFTLAGMTDSFTVAATGVSTLSFGVTSSGGPAVVTFFYDQGPEIHLATTAR